MKSHRTLIRNIKGFTFIEVMIAIGMLALLFSLGLFLSIDVQRGSTFQAEQDIVISLLFKARTRALANVNESAHGLYIDETNAEYVVFEGNGYNGNPNDPTNEPFEMGPIVTFEFEDGLEIVFNPLTARTSKYIFTMSGGGRARVFTVNNEGGITWENE